MTRTTVPVHVRWSDIDGYGHVNNAAMLTLLEDARIAAFWSHDLPDEGARSTQVLAAGPGAASVTLVARQEIEYLAPLPYSQRPVLVDLWIGRIGGASLDVCYEVNGPQGVCARAMSSMVMVDAASGSPRRLTETERAALATLLEEPITFRRR